MQHKKSRKEVFAYWQRRSVELAAERAERFADNPLYAWMMKVVQELIYRFLPEKGWFLKCDLWNEGILEDSWFDLRTPPCKYGLNFVGIDIAKPVCRRTKKNAPSISVVNADLNHLPFKSSAFNFVLDLSTLDHVSVDEVCTILNEFRRVLSGTLLTIFHQEKRLHIIKDIYHALWKYVKKEDLSSPFFIDSFLSVDWMRRGLTKLGFRLQFQRPLNIGAWFPFTHSVLKRCAREKERFINVMNALECKVFPYSDWLSEYWVIVANKK